MATARQTTAFAAIGDLDTLHAGLHAHNMSPGWAKREPSLWPEPRRNYVPFQWRWRDGKAALDAAGRLISTDLAERRNLVLYNPVDPIAYGTLRTLICAYQMILPGERARSHRHTPNALRLILEGDGACTIVQGERIRMHRNDVLLTPNWHWHGHDGDADAPTYWLDCLDVPLVHLLEPMFFEPHPEHYEPNPVETRRSPMIFAWDDTRRALDAARPSADGVFGPRIELGGPAMATIGLHMERLAAGTRTRSFRTTANRIFCPVEGAGTTTIDGESFAWSRGDVIAAPAWRGVSHAAAADSVLFEMTDAPVHRAFGLLRTELGQPKLRGKPA